MRAIVLQGGNQTGCTAKTAKDFIYVFDSLAGSSDNGDMQFQTVKRFDATGQFQDIDGQKHEIFQYVGSDTDRVLVSVRSWAPAS